MGNDMKLGINELGRIGKLKKDSILSKGGIFFLLKLLFFGKNIPPLLAIVNQKSIVCSH